MLVQFGILTSPVKIKINESIQKRAMDIIFKEAKTPYSLLLKKARLETFEHRIGASFSKKKSNNKPSHGKHFQTVRVNKL